MDTLFWTNLKANNNEIKFEGSKTLSKGFTSSLRLDDRWIYCCLYERKSDRSDIINTILENEFYAEKWGNSYNNRQLEWGPWRKTKSSYVAKQNRFVDSVINYKKTHPELSFQFGYYGGKVWGSEQDLIALLTAIPDLAKYVSVITMPSSDEAEQLIRDGYILTKTEPKMPYRAKTQAGYIKKASLEKVVRQVELSPDRYAVSGWFKNKAAGLYKSWYTNNVWTNSTAVSDSVRMSSSNIYFKSEHDIALFALIDSSLTKKVEKMLMDPSQHQIVKLNRVKKARKNARKDKELV